MSTLIMRRKRIARLTWPSRPSRSTHSILGPRQTWRSSGKRFRIICFTRATGRFQAVDDDPDLGTHLGNFSSLNGAKLACERQNRGLNDRAAADSYRTIERLPQ